MMPILHPNYSSHTTGGILLPVHVLLKLSQANVNPAVEFPIQNTNGFEALTGMIQFCETTSQILRSLLVSGRLTVALAPAASVAVFSKARSWMIGVSHGLSLGYCTYTITTSFPATVPVFVTFTERLNITSHLESEGVSKCHIEDDC